MAKWALSLQSLPNEEDQCLGARKLIGRLKGKDWNDKTPGSNKNYNSIVREGVDISVLAGGNLQPFFKKYIY